MGHQATVVIHLDALDSIAEDPEFGKKLKKAILDKANSRPQGEQTVTFNASSAKGSKNAGVVVEVHHSNQTLTVELGGNTGRIKHPRRPVGWCS